MVSAAEAILWGMPGSLAAPSNAQLLEYKIQGSSVWQYAANEVELRP
jgi:hypothetical protein